MPRTENIWTYDSLFQDEKDDLEKLAWRSGRRVSGYLRYLVI
jgi:hypothetical protein